MNDLFDEAMRLTLGNEGGWYDGSDPRDPNPTMYGVIQKRYDAYRDSKQLPRRSVREIEQPELRDIYEEYWFGTCDQLARFAPLSALCLFDMAINAGPGVARKILQRALDLEQDGHIGELDDDGKLGPKTMLMIKYMTPAKDEILCLWMLMERVRYYDEIAAQPRLRPNLKSWIGRTIEFYDKRVRT